MVRAATMFTVFAIFALSYRPSMSVNTLCFTAIIILLQNPYALFDVGFQLSFVAVLSIVLLSPLMDSFVSREWQWNHRLLGCLWSCLSVSVAAQIGVAPLIAYHFGRFSTYFMLTNLIVLPAVYLILIGSLLMLFVAWKPIVLTVLGITSILNQTLLLIARLPLASIENLHPSIVQVILCYIAIGAIYGMLLRYKNIYIRLD
jgi:competence protein ComEC